MYVSPRFFLFASDHRFVNAVERSSLRTFASGHACSRAIANIRKRSLAAKSICKRVETTTNVRNYFPAIVSKSTCTLPTVSCVISDRRICGSKGSVISASRVLLFLRRDVFRLILVRFIATTAPRVRASLTSVFIGRSISFRSFTRFRSRVLYANSSSRSSNLPTQHSKVFATTVLQFPLRASSKRSRLTNIQVKPVARGCFWWNERRGNAARRSRTGHRWQHEKTQRFLRLRRSSLKQFVRPSFFPLNASSISVFLLLLLPLPDSVYLSIVIFQLFVPSCLSFH